MPHHSHQPTDHLFSEAGSISRRSLLKAGVLGAGVLGAGAAALTGALPTGISKAGATSASALPVDDRFYLSKTSHELFRSKLLNETHHGLQSFAFDNVNRRLFVVQQCNKDVDDLCINQVNYSGQKLGHMRLHNAGHGVSVGVEPVGHDSYIWLECDKAGSGDAARGTALLRFPFVPNTTPSGHKYFTGSNTITCATDPIHRRLIVRRREGSGSAPPFYYSVYDLSAAGAGNFSHRLAHVREPDELDGKTFQGYTMMGNWLYTFEGKGHEPDSVPKKPDSILRAFDLNTGVQHSWFRTNAGKSLIWREPEGMAVYKPVGKGPRLFFGFTSRAASGGLNRYVSLYYKDVLGRG